MSGLTVCIVCNARLVDGEIPFVRSPPGVMPLFPPLPILLLGFFDLLLQLPARGRTLSVRSPLNAERATLNPSS